MHNIKGKRDNIAKEANEYYLHISSLLKEKKTQENTGIKQIIQVIH